MNILSFHDIQFYAKVFITNWRRLKYLAETFSEEVMRLWWGYETDPAEIHLHFLFVQITRLTIPSCLR